MKTSTIPIPARFGRWLPVLYLVATVSTSTALQDGDFTYEINDPDTNTVTITDYTGAGGAVVIPSDIDSKDVTVIGNNAFSSEGSLTSVTIGNSVTNIGGRAFAYCTGLTSVTISDNVVSIGSSAFRDCANLLDVTIPDSVATIEHGTFNYCYGLTTWEMAFGLADHARLMNKTLILAPPLEILEYLPVEVASCGDGSG